MNKYAQIYISTLSKLATITDEFGNVYQEGYFTGGGRLKGKDGNIIPDPADPVAPVTNPGQASERVPTGGNGKQQQFQPAQDMRGDNTPQATPVAPVTNPGQASERVPVGRVPNGVAVGGNVKQPQFQPAQDMRGNNIPQATPVHRSGPDQRDTWTGKTLEQSSKENKVPGATTGNPLRQGSQNLTGEKRREQEFAKMQNHLNGITDPAKRQAALNSFSARSGDSEGQFIIDQFKKQQAQTQQRNNYANSGYYGAGRQYQASNGIGAPTKDMHGRSYVGSVPGQATVLNNGSKHIGNQQPSVVRSGSAFNNRRQPMNSA